MAKMKLRVIPEPAPGTRAILVSGSPDPSFVFIRGQPPGPTDLVCGACGRTLAAQIASSAQLLNGVLKCPGCGAFNDTGSPTN